MNQVSNEYIQSIWAEPNQTVKRDMCLHIINNFKYKKKLAKFISACYNPRTNYDDLAKNIKFVAEGLKVV